MSEKDLQAAERIAHSLIPRIRPAAQQAEDPRHFWVALIIALTSMAHIDLGDEGAELIIAAAKIGMGVLPAEDPTGG